MSKNFESKLVLGTAQFGLNYGITNLQGKVNSVNAYRILNKALVGNINTLDTAINYGESHNILHGFPELNRFHLITKLPEVELPTNTDYLRHKIIAITKTFKRQKIDYLLLHRPKQLFEVNGDGIWRALVSCKNENIIGKIGCSIYDPNEAKELMDAFDVDVLQCPYNIFDRRFDDHGVLDIAISRNIEIHVRSIFLQGLLLLSSSKLPKKNS